MKKLILIIIGIFFITFISSSIYLDPVSKNDCVELAQTCENCTFVYLTKITFPNETIIYPNSPMTKNDVNYNYTFCTTDILGDYSYTVKGDKNGVNRTEEGYFTVNPLGVSLGTDKSILYGVLLFFMFIINIFVLYVIFSLSLENYKNNYDEPIGISIKKYTKIFLIGIFYALVILTLNLANSVANSLTLSTFAGIIGGMFEIMIRGAWVWTVIIMIWIFITMWKDNQLIKEIKLRLGEAEWGV